MVRNVLEPSDLPPVLALCVPFFYGLYLFIESAGNYRACSNATSSYAIFTSTWIMGLAFSHYQLRIHCWFHFTLECLEMIIMIGTIIWGFIQYTAISSSNCNSNAVSTSVVQLIILSLFIVITWSIFSGIRIFLWSKSKEGDRTKFTLTKQEISECVVRITALAIFIILFAIAIDTDGVYINSLWLCSGVIGTLLIEMSIKIIFWRFDTIIQVIKECVFITYIFIWFCYGWNSYQTRSVGGVDNNSVKSSLAILVLLTLILVVWVVSLILRVINFNRDYKKSDYKQLNTEEKTKEKLKEDKFTDYNLSYFLPSV